MVTSQKRFYPFFRSFDGDFCQKNSEKEESIPLALVSLKKAISPPISGRVSPISSQDLKEKQIDQLRIKYQRDRVKSICQETFGYVLCFTVVGIPFGLYLISDNPHKSGVLKTESEIWILENAPHIHQFPSLKREVLSLLYELSQENTENYYHLEDMELSYLKRSTSLNQREQRFFLKKRLDHLVNEYNECLKEQVLKGKFSCDSK